MNVRIIPSDELELLLQLSVCKQVADVPLHKRRVRFSLSVGIITLEEQTATSCISP